MMTDCDDQIGAPLVAVMSYRIWQEKYGSDPSVVGASFQINGHPFTVIGVVRQDLMARNCPVGACPISGCRSPRKGAIAPNVSQLKRPNGNYLDILGRVRPGTIRRRSRPSCG